MRAGGAAERAGSASRRYRGDPVTSQVEGLTHEGRGLCRVAGKATFVSDALPGETVRIQPMRRRRGHDEAELLEVLESSPDRIEPRCVYFGNCGGCALQHMDHAAQLAAKQAELMSALERIGKVRPERVRAPVTGPAWAYRRRARLGVRWVRAKGRVLVGFRERAGSFIADMASCEILAGPGRELPGRLAALIGELSIKARLPQVEVTVADNATALVFRVLDEPSRRDLGALRRFALESGCRVYLQPGGLDSVTLLEGDGDPLYYDLPDWDLRIEFLPTDFIQINAEVNALMVALAIEELRLDGQCEVLDLFSGLGNFSLPAATQGGRVTAVEGEAALIERGAANARRHGLQNLVFQPGNLFDEVADFPWARKPYDRVLLDPPRAGARAVVAHMDRLAPARIVYVSCHPGTLARDAGDLARQGFRLHSAGVLDMFPHTAHVESMAVFERG